MEFVYWRIEIGITNFNINLQIKISFTDHFCQENSNFL